LIQVAFTDYLAYLLWDIPAGPALGHGIGADSRGFKKVYHLLWHPWVGEWRRFVPGDWPSVGITTTATSQNPIAPYIWSRSYTLKLNDDDLYLRVTEETERTDKRRTLELHKVIAGVDTIYTPQMTLVDWLIGQYWYKVGAGPLPPVEIIGTDIKWEV
jgi:hypothetical protein